MTDRQRLNYIDICKAFGIILVVLGHTYGIPKNVYNVIYSFHMPLFFILSGFVHNKNKNVEIGFKSFAIKKAKQYLIPYFVFCITNFVIQILWRLFITKQGIDSDYFLVKTKGILFCYSNIENMPNCSPVWFLMCLFIASLIFWWILRIRLRYSWLIIALLLAIYYVLVPLSQNIDSFPYKFPTFFVAAFFMYVGFSLKVLIEMKQSLFRNKAVTIICVVLIMTVSIIACVLTNNTVGMNENCYSNHFLFLIFSTLMSISFIIFFKSATIFEYRFFTWLGKNTIYIIGFNYVCRDLATEIYYWIPVVNSHSMHWLTSFVLTLFMCFACILVCGKTKKIYNDMIEKGHR